MLGWDVPAGITGAGIAVASVTAVRAHAENGAPDAAAQIDAPRLEWIAPEQCPARDEVLAQIAILAAKDDVHWSRFQRVRASVEPAGTRFQLVLELMGRDVRRRDMAGTTCAELAQAAAVAIVLAHRSTDGRDEGFDAP
jgi:hypothetical protein